MSMKMGRRSKTVVLSGVIDENADFSPLLAEVEPLHLDFSGIERVNSIGIRTWMRFLVDWQDKALVYEECPVVISEQLAVLPSLRGIRKQCATVAHANLISCCSKCEFHEEIRVERTDVVPSLSPKIGKRTCVRCGSAMEWSIGESLEIFK